MSVNSVSITRGYSRTGWAIPTHLIRRLAWLALGASLLVMALSMFSPGGGGAEGPGGDAGPGQTGGGLPAGLLPVKPLTASCPNSFCDSGETYLTCPLDCPAPEEEPDEPGPPPPAPYFMYVEPLSGGDANALLTGGAGPFPCGVFDVQGHGFKVVVLNKFPNCTPPDLTVLCLNDQGQWTSSNVKNVSVASEEMTFVSSQHGACGIFSTADAAQIDAAGAALKTPTIGANLKIATIVSALTGLASALLLVALRR